MPRFDPPTLRAELESAMNVLGDYVEFPDWDPLAEPAADAVPPDEDEDEVTLDTVLSVSVLGVEDVPDDLTIADLLKWAEYAREGHLIDRGEARFKTSTYVYLAPQGETSETFAYQTNASHRPTVAQDVRCDEGTIKLRLVSGFTPFAILVAREGFWDSDWGSCVGDEMILCEVLHPESTKRETVDAAVDAFLFELSASHGLGFSRSVLPFVSGDWEEPETGEQNELRLRPLSMGPGLSDVHSLYHRAIGSGDRDYQLINFVKILEYISATVVRRQAHALVRTRLDSSAALRADAAFIDSLMSLMESQRIFRVDKEALRITIETCCDARGLAELAPPSLNLLRCATDETPEKGCRDALAELSACLSSTRNQLAHAKPSYEPTGKEAPAAEIEQLTRCAQRAAEQAIRWFATLPDGVRVS